MIPLFWNIVVPIMVGIVLIFLFGALPRPVAAAGRNAPDEDGTLGLIDAYNYEESEAFMRELLAGLGLRVEEAAPGDEGVLELTAVHDAPVVGGRYEVLCLFRRAGRPVEAAEIQHIIATLGGHDRLKGIVVTTATFQPQAAHVARETMELIDGPALLGLVRKHVPGAARRSP